jgi:hypothetical protein
MFSLFKLKRASLIIQKLGFPGPSACLTVCRQCSSGIYFIGNVRSSPHQLLSSKFSTNQEDPPLKGQDQPLSSVPKSFKKNNGNGASSLSPSSAWMPILTDKSMEELVSFLKSSFEAEEIYRFVGSYRIICEKFSEQHQPVSPELSKYEMKTMIETFLSKGLLTDPSLVATLINGLSLFGFKIPNEEDEQLIKELLFQFNLVYSIPEYSEPSKKQKMKKIDENERELKPPMLPLQKFRSFQNIFSGLAKLNATNASLSIPLKPKSELFILEFSRFLKVYGNHMRIYSRKEYFQLLDNCIALLPLHSREYPYDFQRLIFTSLRRYHVQGRLTTEEKTALMNAFSKLSFSFLHFWVSEGYVLIAEKLFKEKIESYEKLKEEKSSEIQLKQNETIDNWVADKVGYLLLLSSLCVDCFYIFIV